MSITSVNSGNQTLFNNVLPQRTARPESQSVTTDNVHEPEQIESSEASALHHGTSGPLFNLIGVAAYSAIMNPQTSTSMSIEA